MKKYDGGSAFPSIESMDGVDFKTNGMSLRDYFAAQAMAAFAYSEYIDNVATRAYKIADAMLNVREEKEDE